jgi:hypothetical protein
VISQTRGVDVNVEDVIFRGQNGEAKRAFGAVGVQAIVGLLVFIAREATTPGYADSPRLTRLGREDTAFKQSLVYWFLLREAPTPGYADSPRLTRLGRDDRD